MLIESEFTLNHLLTRSNALTILVWKSFGLGLFTIILVSSANNIGMLSFMILGKSLTYIRNIEHFQQGLIADLSGRRHYGIVTLLKISDLKRPYLSTKNLKFQQPTKQKKNTFKILQDILNFVQTQTIKQTEL